MRTLRARLAFLVASCALASALTPVTTAAPAPIATLQLNDGRVLHNVRIMSDEGTSLVVHADEGLMKVTKANLPQAIADLYPQKAAPAGAPEMVMKPFNPDQTPEGPFPTPKPKPAVDPPSPTPRPPKAVYKGCTILSYQPKAFQGTLGSAEVVIRNDTDAPVELVPGDFICITGEGKRLPGGYIVTDGNPIVIKRSELVPAFGEIDDLVAFSNRAIEIASVQWKK